MNHLLKRIEGGKGIEGWIQPVCSCGWNGRKEYAHNDYQHSNIREQEQAHEDPASGTARMELYGARVSS